MMESRPPAPAPTLSDAGTTADPRPQDLPARASDARERGDSGSIKHQIAEFGETLKRLQLEVQERGDERLQSIASELDARYSVLLTEADRLMKQRDMPRDQISGTLATGKERLSATLGERGEKVKAAAETTWTESKAAGAHLGEGFRKAFGELHKAFKKATGEFRRPEASKPDAAPPDKKPETRDVV